MAAAMPDDGTGELTKCMQLINLLDFDEYLLKHIDRTKIVYLILDYDGTLVPLASDPDHAILPSETKQVLERLKKIPNVHIAIISDRNVLNLKDMVGIEGFTYLGNDGIEIIYPDAWLMQAMPKQYVGQFNDLFKSLEEQVCKYGAWVELKGILLTFNYREVPIDARSELLFKAHQLIEEAGFSLRQVHNAFEVKGPRYWDKGCGAMCCLHKTYGRDWSKNICTIYVGDDITDEYAFYTLRNKAATFRVAQSPTVNTSAKYRLPNTNAVVALLKWIEQYFGTP